MNTQELLTISSKEFEVRTFGMSREQIDNLLSSAKFEFMCFVRKYLEENKPVLNSIGPDSPYANLEFSDEVYGNIKLLFFGNRNRKYYRYYATSEKFAAITPILAMFPATSNVVATGKFTVKYTSDGVSKHYYIDVK